MKSLEQKLKPFQRRVRLLRAWHGLAMGATIGTCAASILAGLDFARVRYTTWQEMVVTILGSATLFALIGAYKRVSNLDLADSVDRRGHLANRLGTAATSNSDGFSQVQIEDALNSIDTMRPANVFPLKARPWHGLPLVGGVIASALFLLGNTPIFLSEEGKMQREELMKQGETVEKVAAPVLERPRDEVAKEERDLAKQLDRYAQELKKGRLEKPEAMRKADELMKQAEELAKRRFEQSDKQRLAAMQALEKMATEKAAQELGLSQQELAKLQQQLKSASDSNTQSPNLSQQEREELLRLDEKLLSENNDTNNQNEATRQEAERLKQQLSDIEKMLKEGKSSDGKQLSAAQKAALEKQAEKLRELLKEFQLSEKVKEFMQKLQAHPKFKELMEMAKKLQKANEKGQQSGNPEISEQDIEKMREQLKAMSKELEEFAKKYGTEEGMKELLKQLEEALKCGGGG